MKRALLCLGVLTGALLTGCSSSKDEQLESAQDKEHAYKACFDSEMSKTEQSNCIAKYAPKEVGYKCEVQQVTGSRFGKKVCTTKRQRDEQSKAAKEAMHRVSQTASQKKVGDG